MKISKKKIIIPAVAIVAMGGVALYFGYLKKPKINEKDIVYVSSIKDLMDEDSGKESRFNGVVEPQKTKEIKIDKGRKVKELLVKEGDTVKKGQILFDYDLSSIQDDLAQAKLDLEKLKNEQSSLSNQITVLEKEKQKAANDNKLSYTIEIETNKMNLKKNEYNQKVKTTEVERLEKSSQNTEVRSEMDGVVQKINKKLMNQDNDSASVMESDGSDMQMQPGMGMEGENGNGSFMVIVSTGAYRVKGKVNEQDVKSIVPGQNVIVRSRVEEKETWEGVMGNLDMDNINSQGNGPSKGMGAYSGDNSNKSSNYEFYVDLESSKGLMLGQHVYIEPDIGQGKKKNGLWLSDFYIVDVNKEKPYVWVAGKHNKLEKQYVKLGKYDERLAQYKIKSGLTKDDKIAFPTKRLKKGLPTRDGDVMKNVDFDENTGGGEIKEKEGKETHDEDLNGGTVPNQKEDSQNEIVDNPPDNIEKIEDMPDKIENQKTGPVSNDLKPVDGTSPDGEE